MPTTLYQPVTIEDMQKGVAERAQRTQPEEEIECNVALVLGPNFPTEVADLYCAYAFKKGATITRIPHDDPRCEAIEGGKYEGAPGGVIQSGGRPQQVFLLSPEHVKEFDLIEAINFFDYKGGMVCAICCDAEDVGRALEWGP
ncbi:hypothetical protein HZB05_01260 [Candidatus Wolfebacteria bacterium]|nr:hypothetical protein [Candidatus Wolfebacteria bacterium]